MMDLIGDGKQCEEVCKHAPPEKEKWPCEDCDMRWHDRAEPPDDLISRQAASDNFEKQIHSMFDHIWDCEIDHPVFQDTVGELMDAVIQCYHGLPSAQQWHVIEKRPMTVDERKEWSERLGYDIEYEEAYFYSNLPDDGQEVIVCTSWGHVYVDKYADDGDGGYFEENGEIDGIVAWMEIPKPYKEQT